ncbi:hypothetical protein Pst134EA_017878 [Puccinia striiformis f. sp. tritici]|uniref:chitin deacetylase n=1 Tax=Puccinia striiformis f. sp. tritici PST-78 TaxID=1165861 RepID=A0A0L0VX98_9BASI|nr:hypothetical protein Pst134EA_017878 [Puccinia striiformis f. sp. tritici]KAH9461578.1 hypothetical protein Pst134EA_017878 [Puccinia striiformis f. sp. tritici]KNF03934.1 hypothetical protein PSTG_03021 [Puccinia striiformis f. sp. tritici PST-78]
MIARIFGHDHYQNHQNQQQRRLVLLITIGCIGWITIELIGGSKQSVSAGGQLSLNLWRKYPGTPPPEASSVKLEWLKRGGLSSGGRLFIMNSSRYPLPTTIGPRPKREWISRLDFFQRYGSAEIQRDLSIPISTLHKDGLVTYPTETILTANNNGVCSWENSGCLRNSENGYSDHLDIIHPDPNSWVVNFDDGPLPPSKKLYKVLDDFDIKATHFWIGGNVLKYWDLAIMADRRGDHLAVHTWSHSHLTSLTNHQILGELGWTIQIIFDLTGKVPRFFRPPYGNVDNRVRSIAKHIFGLETVIWNFDSMDWGLNQTYSTGDQVDIADPTKSPRLEEVVQSIGRFASSNSSSSASRVGGLILEHELSFEAVEAFRQSWSVVRNQNFTSLGPLPVCLDGGKSEWYQ